MPTSQPFFRSRRVLLTGGVAMLAWLSACVQVPAPARVVPKEMVYAVTVDMELVRFSAAQPERILERRAVKGLAAGDALVAIDFRVARGLLYALSRQGRLYLLETQTGALQALDAVAVPIALQGSRWGMDFNPVVDRIRVISDSGHNLRLHPDTGGVVATDPVLAYASGDARAGTSPAVLGAGYTYNKRDEKLTTNYAIDAREGTLVTLGSVEGQEPVVSPNTGQLRTVGPLGTGALRDASFDIADVSGLAFAAVRTDAHPRTRLLQIDLRTGRSEVLGTVGDGQVLVGMAIEP